MARIAIVSQERARQIESIILRMYQMGQMTKVSEDQLIRLLEQVCYRRFASTRLRLVSPEAKADDTQSTRQPKKGAIIVSTPVPFY